MKILEIARMCMYCGYMYGCKSDKIGGHERECGNCKKLSTRSECLNDSEHEESHGICVSCEVTRFEVDCVTCLG